MASAGLGVGASLGCGSGSSATDSSAPKTSSPNLLFVFPDQYRRQAMGFMSADPVITPNLDRFASESLVVTGAVSNHPVCSPYRAMLLTGKYPMSTGVVVNCNYKPSDPTRGENVYLRPEEVCVSDVLAQNGYSLGYIGKWHLDRPKEPFVDDPWEDGNHWDAFTPPERRHGFDFWHSYGCSWDHLHPHYWETQAARIEKSIVNEWSPRHETDTAIAYIRNENGAYRDPDRPFALFVAMNPPHPPYDIVPERYRSIYAGKKPSDLLLRPNVDLLSTDPKAQLAREQVQSYFAAVSGVDEEFGRILDCLREQGIEEDTIVVFTSDHGEMMGSQNRMEKGLPYEEAIGIPFLIRWPGKIPPRRWDLLLGVPDVMPTLLSLMGLDSNTPPAVQGTSYAEGFLGGPVTEPDSALYILMSPGQALHLGYRGVRTPTHTYVVTRTKTTERVSHLFDNEKDPYQMNNLAGKDQALETHLGGILAGWLDRTEDPWVTSR